MRLALSFVVVLGLVAGGTAFAFMRPSDPMNIPAPPALASEDSYLVNVATVILPGTVGEVSAFLAANPLTNFVEPTGRIPRITNIEVLEGDWGQPGSLRRVDLEGGDWTHERVLTRTQTEFTYQIWNISTGSGRFINHVYGVIELEPTEGGTELVWHYQIKPAAFFARPSIRTFLAEDFAPFQASALDRFAEAFANQ